METTTRLILPEVIEALESDAGQLQGLTEELHPADLADLAAELSRDHALKLIGVIPAEIAAELLAHCDADFRVDLFTALAAASLETAAAITDEMAADDAADLVAMLEAEERRRLLSAMDEEEVKDVRQLLTYAEDTAGALMTTEFVALPANATAQEAIDLVRENAMEMETIYQAYAVDPHGTILGAVSLRDLVVSPKARTIDEIMEPNIVTVPVDADQEEVARLIAKYDLLALPCVDRSHRVVGIITVDDVMDVVEEEATEDVQKLGAVEPLESPYIQTPLRDLIKARAPWLVVLFVAVLATRNVLEHYATVHPAALMLSWFVPLIASSGGNSGSQSASLVIRALALGSVELRQARKVLARELVVGLALGVSLGLLGILSCLAWDSTRIAGLVYTIALSLVAVVTLGALLGSGIPLLLQRLGIDPAVSSTPFIASIVDIAGLVVYFEIASVFLTG